MPMRVPMLMPIPMPMLMPMRAGPPECLGTPEAHTPDALLESMTSRFGSGSKAHGDANWQLTAVGFEPTQLALVELESTPLDHSGKLS